ncbi:MAG TPA: TonB-dependent receptor plug domain-containing protein, partial [Chitinophagaceae bacterium]|nr:TonB-dependent receptor plug domain-containing protein [Chitinophagaceae bacterium]
MKKLMLLMVSVLYFTAQLLAQDQGRTISGKITDENGRGIASASVSVRGTSVGTTTDAEGNFKLNVPANANTLIVSSVGYAEMQIAIAGKTTVSAQLKPEGRDMDEVVVVAYGTQKKESLTGSIATIGAKQLENRLTTNITQALAGAAPGISTTSGNGQPGSSAAIRIRGFGSINASSSPLFVVDGFPYEGFIGDLNTNDIENISLLKDASATALYGARAANGVVLITTKKGKSAEPKININATTGFSQ